MNIKLFFPFCICKKYSGQGRHTAGAYSLLAQFVPKFPGTAEALDLGCTANRYFPAGEDPERNP